MKAVTGGVTAAKGFMASAADAEIHYHGRNDMAMIFSKTPCIAAGTFTSNVVKAAPVIWDRELVKAGGEIHVVVANSGIANACTGEEGRRICRAEAEAAAEAFGGAFPPESVLIASTGVIGMQLPLDKLRDGILNLTSSLSDTEEAADLASRAIMTTDTRNKKFAVAFEVSGITVHLGGMCKGSGMIHPNMCTMLSFLTTDCAITKELLQEALSRDIQDTYNMVSVDGDTSTNDTCLLLSNGAAGNPLISKRDADYEAFCRALRAVNETLAKRMAEDGEGAEHLFEVKVVSARSRDEARLLAKSVVSSTLTKAAIYGKDANWGRILAAMGYSGAEFNPDTVNLYFENDVGKVLVFKEGTPVEFDEAYAGEILAHPEVTALIEMNEGSATATAWGCDLTHKYVDINADYRS